MRTYAHTHTPQKTYGKQKFRGDQGEKRAAVALQRQGYTVTSHPYERTDLTEKKRGVVRHIQVKNITSRTFRSAKTARRRIAGKPFNLRRIVSGEELWVYDAAGHLYKFGKPKQGKKSKKRTGKKSRRLCLKRVRK